ncbi:MAG: class IV adenylate cyclase [Desulfobacterales bacterium]|nr:class IV adenylate cyclase [Desulfobacterales bacterium]
MQNLEIEVKFYLADIEGIRNKILKLGAKSKGRLFETNIRYEDENNSLIKKKSLLRLRQDQKTTFTLKSSPPVKSKDYKIVNELEVEVSDFATMDQILKTLGFHPEQKYEKWRETFILDQTLFCLDSMPYGDFLEIEGQEKDIRYYASKLDLNWQKRIIFNYLSIFEIMRKNLNLDFNDLTFNNFETVDADALAFLDKLEAGDS